MDNLQRIPLDAITVGDRLRAVDPDHVAHIAASIGQIGQQAPILVAPAGADGRHLLLAGAHRLEALRLIGQGTAAALIVDVDALDRRLIEIDENLMRRELSELDRAVFLAERKAIYEQRHPEARNGRAPKPLGRYEKKMIFQDHLPHGVPGFHRDAAAKLGLSASYIRKLLARARIEPDQRARLAGSRWADHGPTLDAVARYEDPKERRAVVDALTRLDERARNLAAAEAEVFGPRNRDDAEDQFARLMTSWRKAGAAARRRFEEFLRREREDALTETLKAAHGPRRPPEADDA
jgi:ParB family chromosome partitioning protein